VNSQPTGHTGWRDLALNALTGAVAATAAVIYGTLALAYSRFYAELGIRPADAGVQFGAGLAGAAGLTFWVVAIAAAMTIVGVLLWRLMRWLRGHAKTTSLREKPGARDVVLFGTASVVVVGLGLIAHFMVTADSWADRVKHGQPVEPVTIGGIEILGARADLARVEAIAEGEQSSTLRALEQRPAANPELLYLGRSSTSVVLYDSHSHRSEHIPSAYVIVTSLNCETKLSKERACKRLRERDR
jgi:hypothetical protein